MKIIVKISLPLMNWIYRIFQEWEIGVQVRISLPHALGASQDDGYNTNSLKLARVVACLMSE